MDTGRVEVGLARAQERGMALLAGRYRSNGSYFVQLKKGGRGLFVYRTTRRPNLSFRGGRQKTFAKDFGCLRQCVWKGPVLPWAPMDASPEKSREEALCRAVASGDSAAWEALFHRHFDGVYAFVKLQARAEQDLIDDVIQECWLVAVRRIKSFDPELGDFGSWLRGLARNALRSQRRQRRKSRRFGRAEGASEPARETSIELEPTEIDAALSMLPESYRSVLKAKYADDLSMIQIAEREGRTVKSIESLLSRARAAFREAFARLNRRV